MTGRIFLTEGTWQFEDQQSRVWPVKEGDVFLATGRDENRRVRVSTPTPISFDQYSKSFVTVLEFTAVTD